MTQRDESDTFWRVRFIIGNQIREYTERRPGEAFDKVLAEFGEVSERVMRGGATLEVRDAMRLG